MYMTVHQPAFGNIGDLAETCSENVDFPSQSFALFGATTISQPMASHKRPDCSSRAINYGGVQNKLG
jgi:hypothetical protein